MWDYRLVRDEHGIRIVEAHYENDQVIGYAEADLESGTDGPEIRRNLVAAIDACYKPVLVEVDGKLVEGNVEAA